MEQLENTNINTNNINLFDIFEITSNQNNRYLIIGSPGTGKTHMQFQLIFFQLPRYKRHIYIYGGPDALKKEMIPKIKNVGVEVIDVYVNNGTELSKINFNAIGKNDLVIIDDMSHILSERNNDLIKFLNKAYTTSRQKKFDIITILHKLKLNNKMIRENCTKIFITGLNKEIIEEFGENIINPNILPIILDCNDQMKQKYLDFSEFTSMKGYGFPSKVLERITINNKESFPQMIRRNKKPIFIDVQNKDELFRYKIPEGYVKLIESLKKSKEGFELKPESIFLDLAEEQRKIINEGEKKAGNENINKPEIKSAMPYSNVKTQPLKRSLFSIRKI